MSQKKLNPEIKEVEIGTRELRPIKIFPLSANDQFDLASRLMQAITDLGDEEKFDFSNITNEVALTFIQKLITENLSVILEYATDKDERPSFDELTNNQLYIIAEIIFEVNYEGFVKNLNNLFKRAIELMPTK